jgi:hypothetical protein
MQLISHLFNTTLSTLVDVAPIVAILAVFQIIVIRKAPPNLGRMAVGFVYVLLGLTLFLVGLEQALFPVGETMAAQLTDPEFLYGDAGKLKAGFQPFWWDHAWVYAFAAAIGFATTIAEAMMRSPCIPIEMCCFPSDTIDHRLIPYMQIPSIQGNQNCVGQSAYLIKQDE